jgi:hypothetical protein
MKKAIANDDERDEALLSVPEDRQVKAFGGDIILDITTPEKEYASGLFPVNRVYQSADWRQSYNKHWGYNADKIKLFDEFELQVIKRFEQYQVPVIELKKETPKEAVCLVFERVNTGGMPLSVFELLTASFAADDFQLRDDWSARDKRMKQNHPVLRSLQSDDFLQAIALLVTQSRRRAVIKSGINPDAAPGISCKRKDILKLEVTDWTSWAERAERGFTSAARFLFGQKIFKAADLPYRTQLVPMAAIFADLGELSEAEGIRQKIAQWYWCGVLGEVYGSATESRSARDLPEVTGMVRGEGIESVTIRESTVQAGRLLTLRTRNSAAYKGIYALLMRDGGRDFRTGEPIEAQTYFDDQIDIHHIFPEKWCGDAKISPDFFNSIINKTALSARTNRQIGGKAPSSYLLTLQKGAGIPPERMGDILSSHCIEPSLIRSDNYWKFFATRAEALLQRIEAATGKPISREVGLFTPGTKVENYDDGPQELESSLPLENSLNNEDGSLDENI